LNNRDQGVYQGRARARRLAPVRDRGVAPGIPGTVYRKGAAVVETKTFPLAPTGERAILDRLHRLRLILQAMAQETADARRDSARLRVENADLRRRLADVEASHGT
jgi:hypothetical protein